ncbi:MAG: hypothetical protein J6Y98_02950 [Bacteroidales bacterium]|nr:hypothetical protein [Bacteroidales bacterium]
MKKLILTVVLAVMTLAASANSVRYFTRPQAMRVANALDAQNELMIYCGYEYELATYVIINEVWAEPVNSKYYEIWLYGYDAYTGEEIYMPLDLACIWLFNSYGNRMYNAAQYLRFRSTVTTPNFYWTMPPYNAFVRHYHDPHFRHMYTYHYEIHCYGWRPPVHHGGPAPYHPYYMRTPHTPAPVPSRPFTPGVTYPMTPDGHGYVGGNRGASGNRSTAFNNVGGARTGNNVNNGGNPGTTNRNTSANSGSVNGRGNATTGSNNRGNTVNTGSTGGRDNTVNSGSSSGRGNTTSGTNNGSGSNNRGSATNSGSSNNRGSATNSGSSNNRGSATNSGSSNNRGSATNSGSSNNRGSATTTGSNSRGTSGNTRGTTTTSDDSKSTNNNRGTSTSGRSNSSGSSSSTSNNGSRNDNTNRGSSRTR